MAESQPPGEADATPAASAAAPPDPATTAPDSTVSPTAADASAESAAEGFSIDDLLNQASFEDPTKLTGAPGEDSAIAAAEAAAAVAAAQANFELPSFQQVMQDAQVSSIDLLRDVELNVKIELGRSRMMVEDVLKLAEGSVVELDKLAGDPVDVFVNDRLVARGEVLVLNDNFCVRVNEIVAGAKEEAV